MNLGWILLNVLSIYPIYPLIPQFRELIPGGFWRIFDMFFYVVSRTYAEIFSLLRICSGLLSNSPGLLGLCLVDTGNLYDVNERREDSLIITTSYKA